MTIISKYTITTSVNDSTKGTVTSTAVYDYNSTPTLTATANTGYVFDKWVIDGDDDTSAYKNYYSRSITVTGDASYQAVFKALPAKSDIIQLNDGKNYRILSMNDSKAFVLGMDNNAVKYNDYDTDAYKAVMNHPIASSSCKYIKYNGSNLDNYFEKTWYPALNNNDATKPMYSSIVNTAISQSICEKINYDYTYRVATENISGTNYYFMKYASNNVGNRHVYALDFMDVIDYLGSNNLTTVNINKMFYNTTDTKEELIFMRTARLHNYGGQVFFVGNGYIQDYGSCNGECNARASFIIDLCGNGVTFTIQD